MRRSYLWLFLVVALAAGLLFWWHADWWAYVGTGPNRWRKFIMPWWWQLGVSSIVGAAAGGLVVGAAYCLCFAGSLLFSCCIRQEEAKRQKADASRSR